MRSATAVLTTVAALVLALVGLTLSLAGPAAAAGTAFVWSGGGDGESWTDAANWSPLGVPGDGDAATVQAATDDVCHAHVTGVPDGLQLTDLTVDERLFHGDPHSPCLTSIDGGSITVTHQLTFHAGTIGTAITVASGATAAVQPGAAVDTTHFSGPVTVEGSLTLTRTQDENLSLTGSPGITVAAGGVLSAQNDNHLTADCCLSPAHVVNHGTISIATNGSLSLDGVELDQDAAVVAGFAAELITTAAPQTAGAGATWSGAGGWQLGQSSDTTVTGTQTLSKGFYWQLGGNGSASEEYLRGTFALSGRGSLRWDGGVIDAAATLGASVDLQAIGPDGADPRQLDGLDTGGHAVGLTLRGSALFADRSGWYGTSGGRITVTSTGSLDLGDRTTVGADCCNTPATIVNAGGTVTVGGTVALDNVGYRATGGTLDVESRSHLDLTGGAGGSLSTTTITGGGTVGIAEPMTATGTVTVGTATTVVLQNRGSLRPAGSAAATLGGAGSFSWTGGSISGALTVSTAGQTISGTATAKRIVAPTGSRPTSVTFAGPTTVAPGTAGSPDTVQTDPSAHLTFAGPLSLRSNTTLTGGFVAFGGATTVAAGAGPAALSNATVTNTGDLTVQTGSLVSDTGLSQTAGSTTVAAGATLAATGSSSAVRVTAGTLAGSGQVTGNVTMGGGTLAPGVGGVGTLTVTGTVTTGAATTLQVELASGTSHDQLTVGGAATLRGTLQVVDLGGYQPATGDTVTVVSAGSLALGLGCTATTGTGSATQHWTAARSGTQLVLTSRAGASGTC